MKISGFTAILTTFLLASFCHAGTSDTNIIKSHLTAITKTEGFRNYKNLEELNRTADYIHQVFREYTDSASVQEYTVNGKLYKNLIASFGTGNKERVIVGAHYDVCGNQEGADDNASGVVALLELARLLKDQELDYRIDLVAYTLEEPPFFKTENMGSYIHAKSLFEKDIEVKGMLSVEMIGYFSDEENSQSYPLKALSLFYGNKGDFITLVRKFGPGKFARRFTRKFKSVNTMRTKKFTGPKALPGIDFSDHLNYWKFGYSALMITDTSFYRNKNYHQSTDKMETLDLSRMAGVIDGIFMSLTRI